MISSINSMNSTMSMVGSASMQRRPPPSDSDVFQLADVNKDGVVSTTELETLATGIQEVTGNTIDLDKALSTFDADQDGGLNGEELLGLMTSIGFSPPEMFNAEGSESTLRPQRPTYDQALSAYAQNSGQESIAQLIELLQSKKESGNQSFSVDVTS